ISLTASSLCSGRRPREGQRRARAAAAASNTRNRLKSGRRRRLDFPILDAPSSPHRALLGRAAEDFQLRVFVQGALGAALGVEADVAGFYALGIDELAFVGLEVFAVRAHAQARAVIRS